MKNTFTLIFLLIINTISAQDLKLINSELKFPDSLHYEKEIRIYRLHQLTNLTEVFRMHKDNSNSWKVEGFKFYQTMGELKSSRIEKSELIAKTSPEYVWAYFLRANIVELPNMTEIAYKMEQRGEVVLRDGEYHAIIVKSAISDGTVYFVQVRDGDRQNEVYYSNPEINFSIYPDLDELIYFSELLEILKSEFSIWED